MSGLMTIMIGLPVMAAALLVLGVMALWRPLGRTGRGVAAVVFALAAIVALILLRDSLTLFPRYTDLGVLFYGLFAAAAACLAVVLAKRDKADADADRK